MVRPDLRTRQAKAAQAYMQRKGLAENQPYDVIQVDGDMCWYFYYQLPDGGLELEVAWEDGSWTYAVTAFEEDPDRMPTTAGR